MPKKKRNLATPRKRKQKKTLPEPWWVAPVDQMLRTMDDAQTAVGGGGTGRATNFHDWPTLPENPCMEGLTQTIEVRAAPQFRFDVGMGITNIIQSRGIKYRQNLIEALKDFKTEAPRTRTLFVKPFHQFPSKEQETVALARVKFPYVSIGMVNGVLHAVLHFEPLESSITEETLTKLYIPQWSRQWTGGGQVCALDNAYMANPSKWFWNSAFYADLVNATPDLTNKNVLISVAQNLTFL